MLAHSGLWLNLSDSQFHLDGTCEHGAESFLSGIYVMWCVNQDGHNHYTYNCMSTEGEMSWVTTGNLWVQQPQGGSDSDSLESMLTLPDTELPFQSSGVSRIFSASSINISRTPTAVIAEVSMKRESIPRAKASPSDVCTFREDSCASVKKGVEWRW